MKEFWDKRYSEVDWVYGLEPNVYVKEQLDLITPGRVLFMAEGEGRNAIYASQQGWDVHAIDQSVVGQKKALKRAELLGVKIDYQIGDIQEYHLSDTAPFDVIVLCFIHVPSSVRRNFHRSLTHLLVNGGKIILECYTPTQLDYGTGGPKNLDLLYTKDALQEDFKNYTHIGIQENVRILSEGKFHKGKSALIEGIISK